MAPGAIPNDLVPVIPGVGPWRPPRPVAPPPVWRAVERCERACDRFERRVTDPYEAPPGTVPYWLYLEAQNAVLRLRRDLPAKTDLAAEHTPRVGSRADPEPTCSALTPLAPRADAPRLGEIPPLPLETPEPARGLRRYVTTREVATGRIFDAVF